MNTREVKHGHSQNQCESRQVQLTCKPGKTALLMADSKSIPSTGSFLKKIMPPLGPLKDWEKKKQKKRKRKKKQTFIPFCMCRLQQR